MRLKRHFLKYFKCRIPGLKLALYPACISAAKFAFEYVQSQDMGLFGTEFVCNAKCRLKKICEYEKKLLEREENAEQN